jgi:hypothetical protein
MNTHSGPVLAPLTKVLISSAPRRQIVRHPSPGTSAAKDVLNGIVDLSQRVFAVTTARFRRRKNRLKDLPFGVGKIACIGVALCRH